MSKERKLPPLKLPGLDPSKLVGPKLKRTPKVKKLLAEGERAGLTGRKLEEWVHEGVANRHVEAATDRRGDIRIKVDQNKRNWLLAGGFDTPIRLSVFHNRVEVHDHWMGPKEPRLLKVHYTINLWTKRHLDQTAARLAVKVKK